MDTGFVFQVAENFFTGDFENHLFITANVGRRTFKVLTFPAPLLGVALVEVHELAGEEGSFIASGTGPDF